MSITLNAKTFYDKDANLDLLKGKKKSSCWATAPRATPRPSI